MIPQRSKRTGGPKTDVGKSASSKNSLKHGLTTLGFTDGYEAKEASLFINELVSHYKPQSPLENLQIQRIALCRAKLAKLYAVEQASQDLALLNLNAKPVQVLTQIEGFNRASQGMALRIIKDEKNVLPLGLTEKRLKEIKQEVDGLKNLISDELALKESLKRTVRFLETLWTGSDQGEFSADRYLSWAAKKIDDFSKAETSKDSTKESFEEMLENVHAPDELRALPQTSVRPQFSPESFHDSVCADLNRFTQLWMDFLSAKELVPRFHEVKALMAKAMTPSAEETDRLMRYQTSIERRLSSAIGELLALQSRR